LAIFSSKVEREKVIRLHNECFRNGTTIGEATDLAESIVST